MRFLIAFATLFIAVAYAAPLHVEPDLKNESSGLEVKDDNVAKSIEIDETKEGKYEIIGYHSKEKEDNDDESDLEEDFSVEQFDTESNGIELIALFVMKIQPTHQRPLSKYLKGLPLGILNRSVTYVKPKRDRLGLTNVLKPSKIK